MGLSPVQKEKLRQGFKPRPPGAKPSPYPTSARGQGVVASWRLGPEALLGFKAEKGAGVRVACQLPPGLALLCGPESQQPCALGSCLCPGTRGA